jgi:Cofactor assembly of complex C subunit B, CCB2/CCB4
MAKPDQNQVLRQLPIAVGIVAGSLLMVNRLLTPSLTQSQSRSDALGVIMSALLILTGLLWQRIQPKPADAVELVGEEGFELADALPDAVKVELAWASHLLLTNTVTRSLLIWYDGQVLLRRGILGKSEVKLGAIAQRVLSTQKPVYLVKLDLYPGRVEFDYLPENTQGVICQPIGKQGILILAANAPRSYTQQDENWIAGLADKLENTLSLSVPNLPVPTVPNVPTVSS